jgi:hypothetical protein
MPRPKPHPLALFFLRPLNVRAADVVTHWKNSHLVSMLLNHNNELALDVGFICGIKSRDTLATLGRSDDADIKVE